MGRAVHRLGEGGFTLGNVIFGKIKIIQKMFGNSLKIMKIQKKIVFKQKTDDLVERFLGIWFPKRKDQRSSCEKLPLWNDCPSLKTQRNRSILYNLLLQHDPKHSPRAIAIRETKGIKHETPETQA